MRQIVYAFLSAAVVALPVGCGEAPPRRAEVRVRIDTDAPVPSPGRPDLPPALFDTLQLDLFEPGAAQPCAGCSREVAIDHAKFVDREVTFSVLPEPDVEGYRLRARLFRTEYRHRGGPAADSTIDVTAVLPVVGTGDLEEVTVFLATDDVARPRGSLEAPEPVIPSPLGVSRVGTWWGAQRVPCAAAPRAHEACVPGGAYWMGNPRAWVPRSTMYPPAIQATTEQRLVVMPPFYLDRTEVTVEAAREWGVDLRVAPWSGVATGESVSDWCTYHPTATERGALPLNCVMWSYARDYCAAWGGYLPSEAQLEYVGSGLASTNYPWGDDLPSCDDAVYGRAGAGILVPQEGECREDDLGGAEPVGQARLDRVTLDGGDVVDLAGNLSEMTRDAFQSQDGPCWSTGVQEDPVCERGGDDPFLFTSKGGAWNLVPAALMAAVRAPQESNRTSLTIGFRCARPAL